MPLTDRAKEVFPFFTPSGLYQYKVMPFGMKNSHGTFQRLSKNIIADLESCDTYIDELIIATKKERLTFRSFVNFLRD